MKQLLWSLTLAVWSAGAMAAGWDYHETTDQMTGKVTRTAQIESTNSLELGSPYKGQNQGRLSVRQHPRYGLQAIFDVEKGQIMCRSYDDHCGILIRFDNAPPVRFSGGEASDHNPTVVFIRDPKRFIAAAEKAKRILVQAEYFHNGAQVLTFDAGAPLAWNKPASAAKIKR